MALLPPRHPWLANASISENWCDKKGSLLRRWPEHRRAKIKRIAVPTSSRKQRGEGLVSMRTWCFSETQGWESSVPAHLARPMALPKHPQIFPVPTSLGMSFQRLTWPLFSISEAGGQDSSPYSPLSCCVTSGKFLSLSELQFPPLSSE